MNVVAAVLVVFLCHSCSAFYYGYSQAEWARLSDTEKTAAKAKYQPIIDTRRAQPHDQLLEDRTQQVIDAGVRKGL